ncbi:PEP-CTERM sorting domain-containing protein [Paucibacter sp. APW11]|uniref:PEP-CTERM sorting domain-containing protein n=1 Tax=Roseateles aquae TaxID=3077235 RepID=A0ABU3PD02_9BURK|nr:PEP-CTERM sorting domain-containing protein [Paucibacter sp. APW11]MDT9000467.1 PEP-CTERM sorting domain-containing protein [Paucibacter sp. APW11]
MQTSLKSRLLGLALSLGMVGEALAQTQPGRLPEPDSWLLVGLALAAAIAVSLKKRK